MRLFFHDFMMSVVFACSVLLTVVAFFLQLWVLRVESAIFYKASFYSSSWWIEKTWLLLGVYARKKLINEGVKCIAPVAGAIWISMKCKIPKVFTKMLSNRKESAGLIEATTSRNTTPVTTNQAC